MSKLRYIDAIRGLAILGVFIVHVAGSTQLPSMMDKLVSLGAKGVQLFFLASAFTLFLSMDNRTRKEAYPLGNFFIRRFFRIAPLYYIAIIYYYFQFTFADDTISHGMVTSNYLFLHGVLPEWINSLVPGGWSITVEMMFYLAVPFLFAAIKTINKAIVFLAIILCIRMLFVVVMKSYVIPEETSLNHDFLYFCLPNQFPVFAIGICMHQFVKNNYSFNGTKWPTWVLLLASLIINIPIRDLIPYHVFISIGFAVFFVVLSKKNYRVFVNRFTTSLGKISFSLYLVHFAVNFWVTRWMEQASIEQSIGFWPAYLVHFIVIFIISVAISTFLYHFVELKMQKAGSALIRIRERKMIPAVEKIK